MGISIDYKMSYTGRAFHMAPMNYEYKGIRGPVGSGKSVACCWDIFFKSQNQVPAWIVETDGPNKGRKKYLRYSRWLVGRHSFPALKKTTIQTWLQWFPDTQMHWSPPMTARLEVPSMYKDGSTVRIDLEFFAFDSSNIESDLMSLELSGAWINEATQIPWDLIDKMHGRIGRFQPAKSDGVMLDSFGVIMDTNSPDETNWWYRKECVEKPDGMVFFVQPPALLKRVRKEDGAIEFLNNDGRWLEEFGIHPAENVENLKDGFHYWHKQIVGADPDKVKRLILNEFGTSVWGRPVYPEWNDSIHSRKVPAAFQKGLMLLMGSDFGRTPSTVIAQYSMDGVLNVLEEVTSDNMSVEEFLETRLIPILTNKYGFPNCPHINFGDPAGNNPSDVVSTSAIEMCNRHGVKTIAAPGLKNNETVIRIDAVSSLLRRSYKGIAALQVNADGCPMLRKGFNGHYCYRKMNSAEEGDERYSPVPDKNKYSHIHDAFQYLCCGVFDGGIDYSRPGGMSREPEVYSGDFSSDFGFV